MWQLLNICRNQLYLSLRLLEATHPQHPQGLHMSHFHLTGYSRVILHRSKNTPSELDSSFQTRSDQRVSLQHRQPHVCNISLLFNCFFNGSCCSFALQPLAPTPPETQRLWDNRILQHFFMNGVLKDTLPCIYRKHVQTKYQFSFIPKNRYFLNTDCYSTSAMLGTREAETD